jgi:hypothetical protein
MSKNMDSEAWSRYSCIDILSVGNALAWCNVETPQVPREACIAVKCWRLELSRVPKGLHWAVVMSDSLCDQGVRHGDNRMQGKEVWLMTSIYCTRLAHKGGVQFPNHPLWLL